MKQPPAKPHKNDTRQFQAVSHQYYQPSQPAAADVVSQNGSSPWKQIALSILFLSVALLLTLIVWNIINISSASQSIFGSSNVLGYIPTSSLESDENDRVNILIVGYSADRPNGGGATLTDSIMILSIDTKTKDSYMLSVPRDLYVDIPGYSAAKINEAYQAGERISFSEVGYSSGGLGLLEKVVFENLGVDTHYHALVNYGAVRGIVDALGGVVVDIDSPDERGLYDPNFMPEEGGPLRLANGERLLDGQTALRLTRARGSAGGYGFPQSDFNRTQNQQQVLAAITSKLGISELINPLKNRQIFQAIGSNVVTSVEMNEAIPLLRLLTATPTSEIKSYTLRDIEGVNLLSSYTTPNGQSALVPAAGIYDYSSIRATIRTISR